VSILLLSRCVVLFRYGRALLDRLINNWHLISLCASCYMQALHTSVNHVTTITAACATCPRRSWCSVRASQLVAMACRRVWHCRYERLEYSYMTRLIFVLGLRLQDTKVECPLRMDHPPHGEEFSLGTLAKMILCACTRAIADISHVLHGVGCGLCRNTQTF